MPTASRRRSPSWRTASASTSCATPARAERLAADGYVGYGHDHRNPATSPELYGVLGDDGWGLLISGYGGRSQVAADAHLGLSLGLVAHSLA